jgi:dTDP-4-amino-4,6-dideoxygalactose transaminase
MPEAAPPATGRQRTQPPIYVTQPAMPPLQDFVASLEQIWDSKFLTNGGQFHQRLEQALCEHLGVEHISLFANGTLALMTALQALGIDGEVITTPYSFVATSHALLWNGLTAGVRRHRPGHASTSTRTGSRPRSRPLPRAIMPVHCYGTPAMSSASRPSPASTS